MNAQTRTSLGKAIAIFFGMAIVFTALLIMADRVTAGLEQLVLISIGSTVFGSGLTFFLIRAAQLGDTK
jgi:hypothetical protein